MYKAYEDQYCLLWRLCHMLLSVQHFPDVAKGDIYLLSKSTPLPLLGLLSSRDSNFPNPVGFVLSIYKFQGQKLIAAGIQLENPCFSHSQLYVWCSYVERPNIIYVTAPGGKLQTFIYDETFTCELLAFVYHKSSGCNMCVYVSNNINLDLETIFLRLFYMSIFLSAIKCDSSRPTPGIHIHKYIFVSVFHHMGD